MAVPFDDDDDDFFPSSSVLLVTVKRLFRTLNGICLRLRLLASKGTTENVIGVQFVEFVILPVKRRTSGVDTTRQMPLRDDLDDDGTNFLPLFSRILFFQLQNCQDEKYFAKASQVDKIPKKVWIRITSVPKILGLNYGYDSESQPHQRSFSYTIPNSTFPSSTSKMDIHSNVAAGKSFLF